MRLIKTLTVQRWMREHPTAASSLAVWLQRVKAAEWTSFVDLRKSFPSADLVKVRSKRDVVIFNIAGNHYRLVAGVHFNTGLVFSLRLMTHAEYSKNFWKDDL